MSVLFVNGVKVLESNHIDLMEEKETNSKREDFNYNIRYAIDLLEKLERDIEENDINDYEIIAEVDYITRHLETSKKEFTKK